MLNSVIHDRRALLAIGFSTTAIIGVFKMNGSEIRDVFVKAVDFFAAHALSPEC